MVLYWTLMLLLCVHVYPSKWSWSSQQSFQSTWAVYSSGISPHIFKSAAFVSLYTVKFHQTKVPFLYLYIPSHLFKHTNYCNFLLPALVSVLMATVLIHTCQLFRIVLAMYEFRPVLRIWNSTENILFAMKNAKILKTTPWYLALPQQGNTYSWCQQLQCCTVKAW